MSWSRFLLIGLLAIAAPAVGVAADAPLSQHDLMLLNRLTWGVTPADTAEMQKLGAKRWLDRQLHPSAKAALPGPVQAEIDALPVSQRSLPELTAQADTLRETYKQATDPVQKEASGKVYKLYMADRYDDALAKSLLRAVYSPDQLQEQMTWFWTNHFNVFARARDIRPMLADYEDAAIRPHALGRFRDLLEATLRHPAMLRYLDNDQNAAGKINENYAREIMELHTMGVGSGYTQKDVQELARILTGVGVETQPREPQLKPELQALYIRQGDFVFNPKRHDFGDKVFLGHAIKGSGFGEALQALDILSRQPATAHHVSEKLAAFFIGDAPTPALVDRMAQTFQRTDGDIAQVLRTLFDSREFDASLGSGFKDPAHYVISAVRIAYGDRIITDPLKIDRWMGQLSEGLYAHETPDGYPLEAAAWNGPGQMAARFDVARDIAGGAPTLFRQAAGPVPHPEIEARLQKASLDGGLGAPTKAALGQASSPIEWNALFLSSPEFMRR